MYEIPFKWPKNSLKSEKINTINVKKIYQDNQQEAKEINMQKNKKLEILKQEMLKEERILFKKNAINFVFASGNYDAKLMFIGEAPGEEEDIQGIPFVGKSGQLLRSFLKEADIDDFYITNIIPWRPPDNRAPKEDEIKIMAPYVMNHIKIIEPKIIVTVGTTALKTIGITQTITKAQGKIIKLDIGQIFPIYHPSYALRVSSKKKDLFDSLLQLKVCLNEII